MFDLLDRPTEPHPDVRICPPASAWGRINSGLLISALRRSSAPLSIYVHIISKWNRVSPAYLENLIAEIELMDVAHGRPAMQIHWGGNPHALDPTQRVELFNAIVSRFPLVFGADVSLGFHTASPAAPALDYETAPGTDLLGFGVGAVSRAGNIFTQNFLELEAYEDAIAADRLPVWRGFVGGTRS
jgi:coproporphyrinogen III oxidase-like Fe-S oxidoreductase